MAELIRHDLWIHVQFAYQRGMGALHDLEVNPVEIDLLEL
jgi:hypothetical protein